MLKTAVLSATSLSSVFCGCSVPWKVLGNIRDCDTPIGFRMVDLLMLLCSPDFRVERDLVVDCCLLTQKTQTTHIKMQRWDLKPNSAACSARPDRGQP